jgi:hypothetical protein
MSEQCFKCGQPADLMGADGPVCVNCMSGMASGNECKTCPEAIDLLRNIIDAALRGELNILAIGMFDLNAKMRFGEIRIPIGYSDGEIFKRLMPTSRQVDVKKGAMSDLMSELKQEFIKLAKDLDDEMGRDA